MDAPAGGLPVHLAACTCNIYWMHTAFLERLKVNVGLYLLLCLDISFGKYSFVTLSNSKHKTNLCRKWLETNEPPAPELIKLAGP
jgi:hypothetical protein